MATLTQESGFDASLHEVRRPINDIAFIVSHPDGHIVDANDRAIAAYGYAREAFIGLHIDEIRRADPDDRRFLAALVGRMQDCVIVTDADRRITVWGAGAEAMFGWSAGEAIGRTASELFYPDGHDEELRPLSGAPGTWEPLRLQYTPFHKDGHRIPVAGNFTPMRDDAGCVIGLLAVARDVGHERAIEQALRDSRNRHLCEQRLADVHASPWVRQARKHRKSAVHHSNRGHPYVAGSPCRDWRYSRKASDHPDTT
jgi:PAS domain S-box-containing protein